MFCYMSFKKQKKIDHIFSLLAFACYPFLNVETPAWFFLELGECLEVRCRTLLQTRVISQLMHARNVKKKEVETQRMKDGDSLNMSVFDTDQWDTEGSLHLY